ncbi:MAG TPA: hypothetical protein VGG30_09965 [Pirellulales bacterium]|jgi:hypothetical protein
MTMWRNWTIMLSQVAQFQAPPASAASAAALTEIALAVIGIALLWRARKVVAQTTLSAAWCWALASWVAVVGASLACQWAGGGPEEGDWCRALQFAAAMSTVCPAMALAGAKRPQHVAWQWVVLSLWVVLALPAAQWLLFGAQPSLHTARRWFLLVLLVPGVINYLPTRHWLAALLFAAGQAMLLAPYLPGGNLADDDSPLPAVVLIVAAMAVAQLPGRARPTEDPLDCLWRRFCNWYGLVWGLRVAERFNAAAAANNWPVRLTWQGFRSPAGNAPPALSDAERKAIADNLASWLRRFSQGTALDASSCYRKA